MSSDEGRAIGARIRGYREDKGWSLAKLAEKSELSKSYISELESPEGQHKRPSADALYRLGSALGVSMSELLGRPMIVPIVMDPPESLLRYAKTNDLPEADLRMLAAIRFRGEPPKSTARWDFIYQAIRNSAGMDDERR